MKKYLLILVLAIIVIPQVTLASWWNPISWSIFHRSNIQTQVLENRIKELESKLSTPTTTSEKIKVSEPTPITNNKPKPTTVSTKQIPAVVSKPVTQSAKDFRAECKLSRDAETNAVQGDKVRAKITILFEKLSAFDITWDKRYLTNKIDNDEAIFTLDNVGNIIIFANVKRKVDGYSKNVNCQIHVDGVEKKTEEEIRKDSPECKEAKAQKSSLDNQAISIRNSYKKRIEEAKANTQGLETGVLTGVINNLERQSISELADLSIEQNTANSNYYSSCEPGAYGSSYKPSMQVTCFTYLGITTCNSN